MQDCGWALECKRAAAAGVDPYDKASEAPYEMVSFTNSFHGRTLGALALTYKDQYKTPFLPIMPGALMVPYMDLEAAAAVIKKVRMCFLGWSFILSFSHAFTRSN